MKRKVSKSTKAETGALMLSDAARQQMAAELRQAEERIALSALDALSAHIAILDHAGTILAVNRAWRDFARDGDNCVDRGLVGANYFAAARHAAPGSAPVRFAEGVHRVLAGRRDEFSLEYACTVSGAERWFHGKVTRFDSDGAIRAVIAHEDISQRVRLEREILDVSAREQQRFGQELHDGLSQQLTGLKFKASLLEYQLQSRALPEAEDAKAISNLLNEATDEASKLARSVRPVEIEARGLMMALSELASRTAHNHNIRCVCAVRRPVFVHDNNVATHVYRIAEEAITNAVEHGEADDIVVTLQETPECVILTVRDSGRGLPKDFSEDGGIGLHIMRYRARMIGGSIELRRNEPRGAVLSCRFQKRGAAANMPEPTARRKSPARRAGRGAGA